MLFNCEHVGNGRGPSVDIAVDPIDGTSLTAAGRQNALSVIAVSDRGSMLDASSVFRMNKIVTGPAGHGVVDLSQSIGDNIRALAKALGKPVNEIRVAVLDRPRHEGLIEEIRAAGAGTRLLLEGTSRAASTRHGTSRASTCASASAAARRVSSLPRP